MIPVSFPLIAVFERGEDDGNTLFYRDVVALNQHGYAMVMDNERGCARCAAELPGFRYVGPGTTMSMAQRGSWGVAMEDGVTMVDGVVERTTENTTSAPRYVALISGAPWYVHRRDYPEFSSFPLVAWGLREDGRMVGLGPSGPVEDMEGFSHLSLSARPDPAHPVGEREHGDGAESGTSAGMTE